jgi:hypothetical protein
MAQPILLTARLGQIERIVLGADDDDERRGGIQVRRELDREGRVAALVRAGRAAVHPDRRLIVDRAKVQEQPLGRLDRRRPDGAPVPDDAVEVGVVDAARWRFR